MTGKIVSTKEWQEAREGLLKQEKAATRMLGGVSEARRALPMVQVDNPSRFQFDTPDGKKSLVDLFSSRKQLLLYNFMMKESDKEGCCGCSFLMDHIPHLSHLHSRDTSFVAVAPATIEQVEAFKKRMGWKFPFYSSQNTFVDGVKEGEEVTWKPLDGLFSLNVFLKEGDDVFHTYSTTNRGTEVLLSTYAMLDMTPLGRQEGGTGMEDFRLHDKY